MLVEILSLGESYSDIRITHGLKYVLYVKVPFVYYMCLKLVTWFLKKLLNLRAVSEEKGK